MYLLASLGEADGDESDEEDEQEEDEVEAEPTSNSRLVSNGKRRR